MSFGPEQIARCRNQKSPHDVCQKILKDLLEDESNKSCADCNVKGTQWASWNLGIFLCIRCAGIHRNLGVHISKVKSIYLDSWSMENVYMLQKIGNRRAKEIYEANIPSTIPRSEHNINIESWIRMKYELKKYMLKDWIPPQREKDKKMTKCKKKHGKHHKYEVFEETVSSVMVEKSLNDDVSDLKNVAGSKAVETEKIEGCKHSQVAVVQSDSDDAKKKGITLLSALWQ